MAGWVGHYEPARLNRIDLLEFEYYSLLVLFEEVL